MFQDGILQEGPCDGPPLTFLSAFSCEACLFESTEPEIEPVSNGLSQVFARSVEAENLCL